MEGFCSLASGSKGNSFYIGTKNTKLLIDAGMSRKATIEKLAEIGVELDEIDAILITHEHSDHISGLTSLAIKRGIPVLANSETAKAIYEILRECPKYKIFTTDETFAFGDFQIHPFNVQHDAADPVGFTLRVSGLKIGVCTDIGIATPFVTKQLQECDYLFVEANHEPSMVFASSRPLIYKTRVLSRSGHLSNESCGTLLSQVMHDKLKVVQLAHLSQECNNPITALKIVREKIGSAVERIQLTAAEQNKIGVPIHFS